MWSGHIFNPFRRSRLLNHFIKPKLSTSRGWGFLGATNVIGADHRYKVALLIASSTTCGSTPLSQVGSPRILFGWIRKGDAEAGRQVTFGIKTVNLGQSRPLCRSIFESGDNVKPLG